MFPNLLCPLTPNTMYFPYTVSDYKNIINSPATSESQSRPFVIPVSGSWNGNDHNRNFGVIAGVVIGACALMPLVCLIARCRRRRKKERLQGFNNEKLLSSNDHDAGSPLECTENRSGSVSRLKEATVRLNTSEIDPLVSPLSPPPPAHKRELRNPPPSPVKSFRDPVRGGAQELVGSPTATELDDGRIAIYELPVDIQSNIDLSDTMPIPYTEKHDL